MKPGAAMCPVFYRFNLYDLMGMILIGNAIIGVFLLLVCLYTIRCRNNSKWPMEYLLGIVIFPVLVVLSYYPPLNLPMFIFWHCITQYAIMAAIYIGLFMVILRDRRRQL
jgi:hypothetical protein